MKKFKISGDPQNKPFQSSEIIINSLNKAAKNLGIYDENGVQVHYDCVCNDHRLQTDVFICPYELNFPNLILDNAKGRPIIGVGRDNLSFIINGGYSPDISDYVCLGVDTSIWYDEHSEKFDKFTFCLLGESNTRSGYDKSVIAFCEAFSGDESVQLYIRDRTTIPKFKNWVLEQSQKYKVKIIYDEGHLSDHAIERKIYNKCHFHIYVNRSSTWAMPAIQSLACGLPLIGMAYSGPREYLSHEHTGLEVNYSLELVTLNGLQGLVELGLNNYIFPPHNRIYPNQPYWAEPNVDDLIKKLQYARHQGPTKYKDNCIAVAKNLSWEKSALNLSLVLDRWF